MSTYAQAVAAAQKVQADFAGPELYSVNVVPLPPPDDFGVSCVTLSDLGIPNEINGVSVSTAIGIPSPTESELNQGAVSSYLPISMGSNNMVLQPGNVYICDVGSPKTVSLPRAFVTAGEIRVSNVGAAALTIEAFEGDTIAGDGKIALNTNESAVLYSTGGTVWARF